MENFVAGIDVAAQERGFHVALLNLDTSKFHFLFHEKDPVKLISQVDEFGTCRLAAIDAPRRALIQGPETRLAEREIQAVGCRVQWTRRKPAEPLGWMVHGQKLWTAFEKCWGKSRLIETFPSAACDSLGDSAFQIPVAFLAGRYKRPHYKDFIDACICAIVAAKYLKGQAKCAGLWDELGPIYY